MNKYRLKQLLAWVLLKKLLIVNAIDVTPLNPKKFDTVILSVNASGHNTIQWDKGTDTLTTCFIGPNVCSALNNFPGATAAVNAVTVESTITINSANETLHGGNYKATGSTPIDVIVNTLPVTIDWATQPQGNLTSGASAKWIARINCVYPASEINVHFTVYVEGVKEDSPRSPTLTTVPDSSCDSLEETVVAELTLLTSDIQLIQNQKIYIIANASHASFPNEPSVTSVQSAEAIFQLEGYIVGRSTTTHDEQPTTSKTTTTSSLDLQTTDATNKPDSSSSFSEISTDAVSIDTFSVNRGEEHLHLILIIVVSSVCGVIVVSVITVVIVYRYSKSNKCNRSVESDKKKNCDKNEQKGGKRPKDKHQLSKTKNEYQFYNGRVSRANHAFDLSGTVNTRQNQITNMTNRRDFKKIVTVPYNSPHTIKNSRCYGQTTYPSRTMLAFPQSDYNFSRSLCNQQDRLYLGGHHFKDRRTLSQNPFAQQRSNVMNSNYRNDCQLYNSTRSGYYWDKNELNIIYTIDNKPSFRHGQR